MRFEKLEELFINVLEEDTNDIEINVIYKPIGMDETKGEDYFIRLIVQTGSVSMTLEDENEICEDSCLTDEEELYVLRQYTMETVHDVVKQYKEIL